MAELPSSPPLPKTRVIDVHVAALRATPCPCCGVRYATLAAWLAASPTHVYVGRRVRNVAASFDSPYRNRQRVGGGATHDRAAAVDAYRRWLYAQSPAFLAQARATLRNCTLGCWCAPAACHADVLRELCDEER
jgi:hypothetical protein